MHYDLTQLSTVWLPILLDAAIKGMIVLGLAALASLSMRRASASARHLVWFLVLVSLPALPILSATLPDWGVLPGWVMLPGEGDRPVEAAADPESAVLAEPSETSDPVSVATNLAVPAIVPVEVDASESELPVAPAEPIANVASLEKSLPRPADESVDVATSVLWKPWALFVWLVGSVAAGLPILFGTASLWWLQQKSKRVSDGPVLARLMQLAPQMDVRRPVVLLQSARRSMPMLWGLLRPKLLLPATANDWSVERQQVVLLHELAHIGRHDCLTQFVARIVCALYWFNPMVWIALRQLRLERERACDDLILGTGCKPSNYAEQLLAVASGFHTSRLTGLCAIAMARPSALEGRLLAILDPRQNRRRINLTIVLLVVAMVVGVTIPMAMMRAAEDPVVASNAVEVVVELADADKDRTEDVTAETSKPTEEKTAKPTEDTVAKEQPPVKVDASALLAMKELGVRVVQDAKGNVTEIRFGTESDVAALAHLKGMTTLKKLNLETARKVTDDGLANLTGLVDLELLNLHGVGISDAGLVHLAGLTNLRELDLGANRIKGPGLVHLRDLVHLRKLSLYGNQITDDGLMRLPVLPKLEYLDLSKNNLSQESKMQIAGAGMEHLGRFTSLRQIDLMSTPVTGDVDPGDGEIETETGKIRWGRTTDGLQIGLDFDLQDRPFRKGELVRFPLFVRNVGGKAVVLTDFGTREWMPTVRDSTGKARLIAGRLDVPVQRHLRSLAPGDMRSVGSVKLKLDRTSEERSQWPPHAHLEPGTYRVSQKFRFADHRRATWSGELTTGELELKVVPGEGPTEVEPRITDLQTFRQQQIRGGRTQDFDDRLSHFRNALTWNSEHPEKVALEYQVAVMLEGFYDSRRHIFPYRKEALAMFQGIVDRYDHMAYYTNVGAGGPWKAEVVVPQAAIHSAKLLEGEGGDEKEVARYWSLALEMMNQTCQRRIQQWSHAPEPKLQPRDWAQMDAEVKAGFEAEHEAQAADWIRRKAAAAKGEVLTVSELSVVAQAIPSIDPDRGGRATPEVLKQLRHIAETYRGTPIARIAQQGLEDAKGDPGVLLKQLNAGELSDEKIRQITARALDIQANLKKNWHGTWGNWLETARALGKVSDADFARYARQSSPRWSLLAVPSSTDDGKSGLSFGISHYGGRVASATTDHNLVIKHRLISLRLGDLPLDVGSTGGEWSFTVKTQRGFGRFLEKSEIDGLEKLEPGKYEAVAEFEATLHEAGKPDTTLHRIRAKVKDELKLTQSFLESTARSDGAEPTAADPTAEGGGVR